MLKGKKAIITGAGGGIGSAIAYGFAEFGVDVALLDLKVEEIEDLKKFLEEKFSIKALAIPIDVCDHEQV